MIDTWNLAARLRSSQTVSTVADDATYRAVVADFARAFPDDPTALLQQMGVAISLDDHPATAAAEAVHAVARPDAHIIDIAAYAWRDAGNLTKARAAAEIGVIDEPGYSNAWSTLWLIATEQGDVEAVARAQRALDGLGIAPEAMEEWRRTL